MDKQLLKSVDAARNTTEIFALIAKGAIGVTLYNETGKAALHIATKSHELGVMKSMLFCSPKGINVRTQEENDTPLHISLKSHYQPAARVDPYVDILKVLLDQGAEVNAQNSKGQFPIHLAFTRDPSNLFLFYQSFHEELSLFLVELRKRHRDHYVKPIQMLLDKGARVTVADSEGRLPLHFIAGYAMCFIDEYMDLLKSRVEEFDLNVKDNLGLTPLHFACFTGNLLGVQWLTEHGADLNAHDIQGRSPLYFTCDFDSSDENVDLDRVVGEAIKNNCESRSFGHGKKIARYLINKGCDPTKAMLSGETCFAIACKHRKTETMTELCNGKFPNPLIVDALINSAHETCLHIECTKKEGLAKLLLLDFLANPNVPDNQSRTALDIAFDSKNFDLVPFICYKEGTSKAERGKQRIYKIYKHCTKAFLDFLEREVPHLFQREQSTKTFVEASTFVAQHLRLQPEEEIRALLFTAIKFRERFNARLGGGDAKHKHFVKVLRDCESILWPKFEPQGGEYKYESGLKVPASEIFPHAEEIAFEGHASSDTEDDEIYYPLSTFAELGDEDDDDVAEDLASISTKGFFE